MAQDVFQSFLVGSFSGACSTLLLQPLDLLKTRMQIDHNLRITNKNISALSIYGEILKHDKLFGLWKGTAPSLLRCVPGVGLYFCCLHTMSTNLCKNHSKPTLVEAVTFGVLSRIIAGSVLLPFTLIKTRYESGIFTYRSIPYALKVTYLEKGMKGLFTGLMPTLLRDAPFSGIYYMFYSQLKMSNSHSSKGASYNFLCGILAGIGASIVTHPADVIKTKMQLHPERYPHFRTVVISLFKENKLNGFFSGLTPRLVRRTLMATLAWTMYESVIKVIRQIGQI